jgi:hypothetical protein
VPHESLSNGAHRAKGKDEKETDGTDTKPEREILFYVILAKIDGHNKFPGVPIFDANRGGPQNKITRQIRLSAQKAPVC